MARKRILLAGLFHETTTFAPGEMGLDQFAVARGEELLAARGNGSPLGAVLEEAERFGWEVLPVIDIRGTPGAMPSREVVDTAFTALDAFAETEAAQGLDAICLILHGAMAGPGCPDVEGTLLARLRAKPAFAHVPIFGVLDLHANFTPAMAEHSNGLLVYLKNPHTDAAETGTRCARLLEESLNAGRTLATRFRGTNLLWPPPGTGTAVAPMATLEAIAREEEREGIAAVNVFAGFAQADTPHTGVSFSIVYDPAQVSPERLAAVEERLHSTAVAERELGLPHEWELGAAITDALEKNQYPTLLVEPADNIGGGATGDGTSILRALLERGLQGGVVLCDPEVAAYLHTQEPGTEHDLQVGGKTYPADPGPVSVRARLIRLTDGNYELEDRHSHAASMSGVQMQMGPSAVVEVGGVTLLITSLRHAPMDLGQWRSQGVEPSALPFIGVKAAVAHRQAYDKIAKASYWVRTIGPCTSDLAALPYQLLRRPVFPLDAGA